jgi:AcrR family transcriptional regulator
VDDARGTGTGGSPGTAARRRDAAGTRNRILVVAGRHFARHGYDGTHVRAVAADAGVAPNLVTRYFGGKAGLFAAATTLDLDVPGVLPGPFAELGARIATNVVRRWESADAADPLLMMLRSAGTSPAAAEALGQFFAEQAARPLTGHLLGNGGTSAEAASDRVAAVQALIMGVVISRYVMPRGRLAEAPPEAVTAWLGDQLQRILDGPPPPPLAGPAG